MDKLSKKAKNVHNNKQDYAYFCKHLITNIQKINNCTLYTYICIRNKHTYIYTYIHITHYTRQTMLIIVLFFSLKIQNYDALIVVSKYLHRIHKSKKKISIIKSTYLI